MKPRRLYHRVVFVCIVLGCVAAWNVLFLPSVPAALAVKLEIQEQEMELQEEGVESIPGQEEDFEENDPLSIPDENSFDCQPQDESVVDDPFQEEETDVDEEVLDEEALDEIEELENPMDEYLEPSLPAE